MSDIKYDVTLDRKIEAARVLLRQEASDRSILTSSFGIGSSVMLHLVANAVPNIQVVFIDTGYLFAETYKYRDNLSELLSLRVRTFTADQPPASFESLHGPLWETNLELYHKLRKLEPMQNALAELQPEVWVSGIRAEETAFRKTVKSILDGSPRRVHPILTWTNKDIWYYRKRYDLPEHPLAEAGYFHVGDWHSSQKGQLRFDGSREECGLHTEL